MSEPLVSHLQINFFPSSAFKPNRFQVDLNQSVHKLSVQCDSFSENPTDLSDCMREIIDFCLELLFGSIFCLQHLLTQLPLSDISGGEISHVTEISLVLKLSPNKSTSTLPPPRWYKYRTPHLRSTDLMLQAGRDRRHAALSHSWQHGRQHGEQHEGIVGFRQQGAQAARDLLIDW